MRFYAPQSPVTVIQHKFSFELFIYFRITLKKAWKLTKKSFFSLISNLTFEIVEICLENPVFYFNYNKISKN